MGNGPKGDSSKTRRRRYSGGLRARDLPGLWRRDWRRAYAILTRDHDEDELPRNWFARQWYRAKTFFLELSYKLSPARRLLFVLCLVFAFLGLQEQEIGPIEDEIEVLQHPAFLLFAVIGLVFLLILELADRVQVRDELEVARQLQWELLPQEGPAIEGYEFAFSYRSANTVGGDYYDFQPLGDGRWALAIGDASGHGIAAAMLMAISNTTLKLAIDTDPEPRAVARMVNRALVRSGGPRSFLTLFYALLEPETGRLTYVCAGHPYPFLLRRSGELTKLGSGSFPLGLREDLQLATGEDEIEPGDVLLLYSDGIPEALGESGDAFGFERLEECLQRGGGARRVHDRILRELTEYLGDRPLEDDRSLVVIARPAA